MNNSPRATITRHGAAPFFVFADHASNAIPDAYHDLGLPADLLQTHIAWDIGAGALAFEVAERLKGVSLLCAFSRLVVDSNRALDTRDLIPETSDQIPIPGNQGLNDGEWQRRINDFHRPYHDEIEGVVETLITTHAAPFVVSIHSFSQRLLGALEDRPWHIGLLWREDEASAKAMIGWFGANTNFLVGDNQPYDARVFNYSVDRHIGPRALPHLTLEVRQDLLSNKQEIAKIADILARGVTHAASHQRSIKEADHDSRPDARY